VGRVGSRQADGLLRSIILAQPRFSANMPRSRHSRTMVPETSILAASRILATRVMTRSRPCNGQRPPVLEAEKSACSRTDVFYALGPGALHSQPGNLSWPKRRTRTFLPFEHRAGARPMAHDDPDRPFAETCKAKARTMRRSPGQDLTPRTVLFFRARRLPATPSLHGTPSRAAMRRALRPTSLSQACSRPQPPDRPPPDTQPTTIRHEEFFARR
jgi:hypothetical protein